MRRPALLPLVLTALALALPACGPREPAPAAKPAATPAPAPAPTPAPAPAAAPTAAPAPPAAAKAEPAPAPKAAPKAPAVESPRTGVVTAEPASPQVTARPAPPPPAPAPTVQPAPAVQAAPQAAPASPVSDPGGEVAVKPGKAGLSKVGAAACKMCHKVQFASWSGTAHAKRTPPLDCEGCHGPGSEYKAMPVMKDPAKAKAAGLVQPGAAFCATCHKRGWNDGMLKKAHDHKA